MYYLVPVFLISFLPLLAAKSETVAVDYFVTLINSRQTFWRAARSSRENTTRRSLMHSNNPVIFLKDEDTKMKACDITGRKIPETFDARLEWPACRASIERINNQGNCSSCWVSF